jgi:hypothetical protein
MVTVNKSADSSNGSVERISRDHIQHKALLRTILGFAAQFMLSAFAAAQSAQPAGMPPLMDREKESALALSSCPPSIADKAAVYVLDKSGYVKVRDSQNGFAAIVQHPTATGQAPQCMDAEGARTFLPRILKVAELRSRGKIREEIQRFEADAIATGVFPTPQHPGVIYMLSTENLTPNEQGIVTPFPPHVMFYGMHLTNADLGVEGKDLGPDGNPKGPTFVAGAGPYALIIVPVAPHGLPHDNHEK